jgi:hypothetical protein
MREKIGFIIQETSIASKAETSLLFPSKNNVLTAKWNTIEETLQRSGPRIDSLWHIQEVSGSDNFHRSISQQPASSLSCQKLRIFINGRSPNDELNSWIKGIVFDNGKNSAGSKHPVNIRDQWGSFRRINMMKDADCANPVYRLIVKWKANRTELMDNVEIPALGNHSKRNVATQRLREMCLRRSKQITLTTSYVEPDQLPGINALASREIEEHIDLAGEEEL